MAGAPDPTLAVTVDARVVCTHELGKVALVNSQQWVRISELPVLIEPDPEGRSISGCPNFSIGIKPCLHTLSVRVGYSSFVRIDGHPVVRSILAGFTDGTPPGVIQYVVRDPAQPFVRVGS
ncbi:MAG: hypothetical protein JWN61_2914 [Pseudonocardiales bacterium]|nr:hypothetical protein [Pseudonocardiales bacterium]